MRVLITGATGGIGQALAMYYAANGHELVLFARDSAALAALQQRCEQQGGKVEYCAVDLAQLAKLRSSLQQVQQTKPLDLVIANAGVSYCLSKGEVEEPWSEVQSMLDINMRAVIATLSTCIPFMLKAQKGQLAIVSSLAGHVGLPISPTYSATKAGIKAYGEALRAALAGHGIGVSVVLPGFVKSKMSDKYPAARPFMLSAERAASYISMGLAKNRARIAFPFSLALGSWFLTILPARLSCFILRKLNFT